ncbi:multiple sugar transport system permease protein [Paenibacillus sp. UNCCL117]|uniref:carbohydrate ABC transporter permease n=1 Tax=unclassified Paenibacillus TaxID=185978 RepID=UPI00088D84A5|nr:MULTISPECIES: carbohydrate ABC transporter permease [unclassified Paenibacillus]SDE14611.1 carbohydrate ABC transporter membrane protein 2, CUT1 family [Paenibacillus sp. cl123]SFW60649.1 multiple sugar transport system permease protein [Paenibacillus sp. UNCCL117]
MLETRKVPTLVFSLFVGIVSIVMMVPIILTITNSLMTEREMSFNYDLVGKMTDASVQDTFVNLKLIPDWITLDQYTKLLITTTKFLQMFWNSVRYVVPIVAGQAAVAALAAYAFARLRFRGRDTLFMIYLMTMLMPFQVTLVPNYIMIDKLGLMNTSAAIILPGIFGAFGVFMIRQFMANLPHVYTEAGKMDGAGHFTLFLLVILPLVRPGLAALIVLLFVDYWNMVEQPLIFLKEEFQYPLSLYLSQIQQGERGVIFAASVLYMAPMILLFLYAETYLIEGIEHSGIKG